MTTKRYFGTDGIRARVGTAKMHPEFIMKLGWAVGQVFRERFGVCRTVIGKDTRVSGYLFESALQAGLSAAGADVYLTGPMPTPAIAYLTRTFHAQTGIVISASHNPYWDNGIKFFTGSGVKLPDGLELEIEAKLDAPMELVAPEHLGKSYRIQDAPGRYIEFCKNRVAPDLSFHGKKVVVDCAHGATYHIAGAVFRELGADLVEMHANPDGFNINADCGAVHPEALQARVLSEKADVGLALDGDGDRAIMVDEQGHVLDGDDILYLIAQSYRQQGREVEGVVGTVMTNMGIEKALEAQGMQFVRAAVGDRHIAAALQERGWILGGESSGHIICRNTNSTGDGIVAGLKVLAMMIRTGQSLSALRESIQKWPQTLLNVPCANPQTVVASKSVQKALSKAEKDWHGKGRILIRASGTEPVVRVMVEGREADAVSQCAQALADVVSSACVSN